MAHPCIYCGGECFCCGDLDDVIVCKTPKMCQSCGCEEDFESDDDDLDQVGYECLGCMRGFANPGDCPICGNPLEPYG